MKALYAVEQKELEKRYHHSKEGDRRWDINPYELTVCSSAACVDLLFWAVREEPGKSLRRDTITVRKVTDVGISILTS